VKKLFLAVMALVCMLPAFGTPITGHVALAGADVYTTTGIHFTGPAVVLIGTGNFLPFVGDTIPINPPSHELDFSSAAGVEFFDLGGITMDLLTLSVVSQSNMFLNIAGTANMVQAGFDTTPYVYTLTATRPDGVSSFTMTAVPASAVPEPESLLLVGTGLLLSAGGTLWRSRRKINGCNTYQPSDARL
jgi:hypothetical protein